MGMEFTGESIVLDIPQFEQIQAAQQKKTNWLIVVAAIAAIVLFFSMKGK
jgi:hypothetical protein